MPAWKSQVITFAVPFKILSAAIGAVSYCWQMNFCQWLFYDRLRPTPFNWQSIWNYPTPALLVGAFMGYISASVFVLWCRRFYQTASFVAFATSSWCVYPSVAFICLMFFLIHRSLGERLLEVAKLLMVFGMPFFWGLILQVCARRLRRSAGNIET